MQATKTILKSIFAIAFLSTNVLGYSQLAVDADTNTETLIEDFLLGSGVLIENVMYTGSDLQIGSFTGGGETVGMADGIIMSSGGVASIADGGFSSITDGVIGDADLLAVANTVPPLLGLNFSIAEVFDVSSLEFVFVPIGDSLAFNFVFGSDEYLEWVNSPFNDVFGFFIAGPGIEGPYSAPAGFENGSMNIAYVPESDPTLPITVSSVNDQVNSDYYIDNVANVGIYIDGYTQVITAYANGLTPGETYHMRLAIADGSDMALESMVMLEAGSFSSYETVEPGALGDLDGDGDLDVDDLLLMIGDIGCIGLECDGDLNDDAVVNVWDIIFFLGLF